MPDATMPAGTSPVRPVDPVTLEIIRGSLASTIRDMELLMERCAMSPFIKEKKDYFVGVFDTQGAHRRLPHLGQRPGDAGGDLQGVSARHHAAGRRVLVQRPVHLRRRRPASSGHGLRRAHLPRGAGRRVLHHLRALPGHRRIAGGEHLAARDGDLPRGRARPARPHRARGAAQRGGVPDLPAQLAPARPRRGGHARHDGVVPPGRDAPRRAVRALRGADRARGVRRVHRPDGGAGARAVPRARARGRVVVSRLPRQRRRDARRARTGSSSPSTASGITCASTGRAPTTRRAGRSTS